MAHKDFTKSNGSPPQWRTPKMTDGDPHNLEARIQNTVENIKTSDKISSYNKDLAADFLKYLEGQGLSKNRISRYLYSLKTILEEIEWELDKPDKDKLIELVGDINQSKYWDDSIAEATKKEYKKLIRKFYRDYLSTKKEINGKELTDFFSTTVKKNYADPDELPKPKHVAELVRCCKRPRDKSFIMLLWSSSARIGAMLGLRWKDIRFHEDIATVKFRDTKTGGNRTVPIASAFPYLKRCKEADSLSRESEAFIFRPVNSFEPTNQLSYNGAKGIIERAAEKADIPDHIRTNPHAFRKGRISDLARKGFSEAQVSKVSGHIIGSDEIRVYCRLASEDITSSIREEAGLETEDKEVDKDPLRPKKCPNKSCNHLNKWECQQCTDCGEILDEGKLHRRVIKKKVENEVCRKVLNDETEWDYDKIAEKAEEIVKEEI